MKKKKYNFWDTIINLAGLKKFWLWGYYLLIMIKIASNTCGINFDRASFFQEFFYLIEISIFFLKSKKKKKINIKINMCLIQKYLHKLNETKLKMKTILFDNTLLGIRYLFWLKYILCRYLWRQTVYLSIISGFRCKFWILITSYILCKPWKIPINISLENSSSLKKYKH